MKSPINKIIRNLEARAAFNTEAAITNLHRASLCVNKNWEHDCFLANAREFQNRSAQYAKEARILRGIE